MTGPKTWQIAARVDKYDAADMRRAVASRPVRRLLRGCSPFTLEPRPGARPYESIDVDGNLLLNAGIQRLEDLLIVAGGQGFDAAHSRIGVGNDATAAVASQTDLQAAAGAGNRQFKLVDAGPTRSTQTITWRATFPSGEANFAWQEWGIDVGTADSTVVTVPLLNRKVTSLGTKVAGAVWQFTVTLTIS